MKYSEVLIIMNRFVLFRTNSSTSTTDAVV